MTIEIHHFADWMRTVHGVEPFPWQQRLLERILAPDDGWPDAIDIPTGCGKTAVIDVALFALAHELNRRVANRRSPLRILFVVDRRIIVDAAFRRACTIWERLRDATTGSVVDRVRESLLLVTGDHDNVPLDVAELRGGIHRESRWTRTPSQPTILCSTVDQIGSRLLFRGYGLSLKAAPIHAGLLGEDCLYLIDEAHLSSPFVETLERIGRYREEREEGFGLPWKVVTMSATQHRPSIPRATFRINTDDRQHPILRRRLGARKPIQLTEAPRDQDPHFAKFVADQARAQLHTARTILVVVNRVDTARHVFEELHNKPRDKSKRNAFPDYDTLLLTGRTRAYDRDRLLRPEAGYLPRLRAGRTRDPQQRHLIVVATQCVEVGADFDADALVTELCPLDALRQRLGRLNRFGELEVAPCVVVARPKLAQGKQADPVYGPVVGEVWQWLREQAAKEEELDGSANAQEAWPHLITPPQEAPILFQTQCELLAMTSTFTDEIDISCFLHGRNGRDADVQLVWRADLSFTDAHQEERDRLQRIWKETVALAPPLAGEALAVPASRVRAWLTQPSDQPPSPVADVEGLAPQESSGTSEDDDLRFPVLRWHGDDDPRTGIVNKATQIQPGDVLILPSEVGGCDVFGWNPLSSDPVRDLRDEVAIEASRTPILRLHPACVPWEAATASSIASEENTEEPEDLRDRIEAALAELAELQKPAETEWPYKHYDALATLAQELQAHRHRLRIEPHPSGRGYVLIGRRTWTPAARDYTDEGEVAYASGVPIYLADHLEHVGLAAESIGRAIGLSEDLQTALRLAGELHDIGKSDPRFQRWLRGGDVVAAVQGPALAKSPDLVPGSPSSRAARQLAGYPRRYRHELLSSALAASAPPELLGPDAELVLHLIESHHGHARPFAPYAHDPRPIPVHTSWRGRDLWATTETGAEILGSGVSARFFRLQERYGLWGLAFLEACLRLADWMVSERESEPQTDPITAVGGR